MFEKSSNDLLLLPSNRVTILHLAGLAPKVAAVRVVPENGTLISHSTARNGKHDPNGETLPGRPKKMGYGNTNTHLVTVELRNLHPTSSVSKIGKENTRVTGENSGSG